MSDEGPNIEIGGGVVVKPGEVLVIVLPHGTEADMDEATRALEDVGLAGRALVLLGEAQLSTAPQLADIEWVAWGIANLSPEGAQRRLHATNADRAARGQPPLSPDDIPSELVDALCN